MTESLVLNQARWDFTDIWFTVVVAKAESHFIEFKVYQIRELYEDDKIAAFGGSTGRATSIESAESFLSGYIKWDGCSNWNFDRQEKVMLHFCDSQQAENIGVLFKRLYDIAREAFNNHWF